MSTAARGTHRRLFVQRAHIVYYEYNWSTRIRESSLDSPRSSLDSGLRTRRDLIIHSDSHHTAHSPQHSDHGATRRTSYLFRFLLPSTSERETDVEAEDHTPPARLATS
eukprot:scaffold109775_cov57-Phaeocystis_antarctica.AAC.1